jgi:hypothetical protein
MAQCSLTDVDRRFRLLPPLSGNLVSNLRCYNKMNRDMYKNRWDLRFSRRTVLSLVFLVVAPCDHVEVYRRFRSVYSLHQTGRPDEGCTSETSVYLNVTTLCYNPEDPKLHVQKHFKVYTCSGCAPCHATDVRGQSVSCYVFVYW